MPNVSNFKLLNVPLENDYKHTLHFDYIVDQYNYFVGREYKPALLNNVDVTYIRPNQPIRINMIYDDLIGHCNYVMYQNLNDRNRIYYAFITDIKYVDEGRTDIYIETDCIQTWLFDYNIKTSFVEREHVDNDTIGLHTVPEGVETGEYVCMGSKFDEPLIETNLVVGTTVNEEGENITGALYNGIYSGLAYLTGSVSYVNTFIKGLSEKGKSEAVNCIFIAPKFLCGYNDTISEVPLGWDTKRFESIYGKPNRLASYTPKNNKLLTFPYCYLLVGNNNGGTGIYKYEYFTDTECEFSIEGSITPGCSIRLIPKNYKNVEFNNEEGLNLGKYPICNWASDVYTNWLTQNSVNIGIDLFAGSVQTVSNIMMGSAIGGVPGAIVGGLGGVAQIGQTLAQVNAQSFTPPQSKGNTNCGDVITSSKRNTFTYYQMCVKPEYAKIIDEYFTMFGYKVNRVKVPNKAHRSTFWYTKTIDVNIDGPIPNKDLEVIKKCYNNGITFWRKGSEIQNYALSNTIV